MKDATGELGMTVVVILAIIAVIGILSWLAPRMQEYVETKWGQMENTDPLNK